MEIGKSQPEGPSVPVGNEARRVSHWNDGPEGQQCKMCNQASSVRSIYLPPLKYRNFSIFKIEVCKKNRSYTAGLVAHTR